jgi:hypothetical protein
MARADTIISIALIVVMIILMLMAGFRIFPQFRTLSDRQYR